MNCCRSFCGPQEGSESKGQICCDLPSSGKVSGLLDLQILWCLPEWVLHPQSESSEPKPGDYRPDYPTAEATQNTYDYRRMQLWLNKNGCHGKPKTILRLNALLSEIHGHRQWKQLHKYQNLLNRIFQAEAPNHK